MTLQASGQISLTDIKDEAETGGYIEAEENIESLAQFEGWEDKPNLNPAEPHDITEFYSAKARGGSVIPIDNVTELSTNALWPTVAKVSTTRTLIAWSDVSGSLDRGRVLAHAVSSEGALTEEETYFAFEASTNSFFNKVQYLGSDRVLVFWQKSSDDDFRLRLLDIDGSTGEITALSDSGATITSSTTSAEDIDFIYLGGRILVFYDGEMQAFSVNFTTGAIATLGSGLTVFSGSDHCNLLPISDTRFIGAFQGTSDDGFVRMYSFNNSTGAIAGLDSALEFDTSFAEWITSNEVNSTRFTLAWVGPSTNCKTRLYSKNDTTGVLAALDSTLIINSSGDYLAHDGVDADSHCAIWTEAGEVVGEKITIDLIGDEVTGNTESNIGQGANGLKMSVKHLDGQKLISAWNSGGVKVWVQVLKVV